MEVHYTLRHLAIAKTGSAKHSSCLQSSSTVKGLPTRGVQTKSPFPSLKGGSCSAVEDCAVTFSLSSREMFRAPRQLNWPLSPSRATRHQSDTSPASS